MRRSAIWTAIASCFLVVIPGGAGANPTDVLELLPVLHSATARGAWHTESLGSGAVAAKTIDGDISDWTGAGSALAGTTVYSAGEMIYTDHLFDAYGADDGIDADRVSKLGPAEDALPQTYRIEPLLQADAPGEVGAPNPYPVDEEYGDAPLQSKADLIELRIAADATNVYVLARTAAMTAGSDTAILLLADTTPGIVTRSVPFNTGISTGRADIAVLLANGAGRAVDLSTAAETSVPGAANPTGYTNALEASIPRSLVQDASGDISIAVATGTLDGAGFKTLTGLNANLGNVAFRPSEPVRTWFDEQQALSLYAKTIDPFFAMVDVDKLLQGANERVIPEAGYFERIFTSAAGVSSEGGMEGIYQPYGIYFPPGYGAGSANVPLTFWFHWRGGKTHSAASTVPGFMRDMGDALGGLVVSPRGRGTSTWYLGKGMNDFQEVWQDATSLLRVDLDRVYISGHSMGGWASYLMPILFPDRFAASFPASPPVTQGAWTGADFPGCDSYRYGEYTFCYIAANDSNPRVQHTRKLLENLRNVPIAIYAGGIDELVPISGVTLQAQRLVELGYQHRFYLFPTYEHYSPPVVDQWGEGARYFSSHTRDANPARVSYIRDMPFERSVEIGPSQFNNPTSGLSFNFDRAYWMSELTPADPVNGRARFEGRTLAKKDPSTLAIPEAGGPSALGQSGPYSMTGLAWLDNPLVTAPTNGFTVSLTGATKVRLDVERMALDTGNTITGTMTTDGSVTLELRGTWPSTPAVTVNGSSVAATYTGGVLSITVPAGTSTLSIT